MKYKKFKIEYIVWSPLKWSFDDKISLRRFLDRRPEYKPLAQQHRIHPCYATTNFYKALEMDGQPKSRAKAFGVRWYKEFDKYFNFFGHSKIVRRNFDGHRIYAELFYQEPDQAALDKIKERCEKKIQKLNALLPKFMFDWNRWKVEQSLSDFENKI